MKKLLVITFILFSSMSLKTVFAEDIPTDQTLLYQQLQNKMQNSSPEEIKQANSDPDLAKLMEVMKLVQGKDYKSSSKIIEDILKKPEGKGITPQSKAMLKNLLDILKAMDTPELDLTSP